MWTALFWKQAVERAVKSAAQGYLTVWGLFEQSFDGLLSADPLKGATCMAVLSVLTSVISGAVPTGPAESPSLVDVPGGAD